MVNETWTTVVGNVANDVSWRRTTNGGEVANFRVMSTERRFDPETGSWQDGARLAVRVSCWRRLGENVRTCIAKGDPVVVIGKLSVREYEADGVRRTSTELEARSVGLDLSRVAAKVVPAEPGAGGRPVADVTGLAVVEGPTSATDADPELVGTVGAPSAVGPFGGVMGGASPLGGEESDDDLDKAALAG
ncbi:single-stranded DNA-binding protein [Actinomycetospora sp. TBRC 11914]|uniref:single-stranded DNA-binding protein n=1 Tax=Actinomycetospora sp. TBRC 11914 TaxID=2729387 RepID=UPI00145E3153|nr:single-stranded DNA-binding protein [Actinomycetospora sp. TBRC 11914]NMO94141.1 single-stranded DNA-binding protein [Actinomycetospora sp. TBRC 11914]